MKKISVRLYTALMFLMLSFIPCGTASADEALADSMAPGTWTADPRYITFGEYNGHTLKWRVLEVYGDKTAFLVLDDVLRNTDGRVYGIYFDSNANPDNNKFSDSEIYNFLNGTFLNSNEVYKYNDGILDTAYGPDNGTYAWKGGTINDTASSKVFLLSVGELINPDYFRDGGDRAVDLNLMNGLKFAWLRSPGFPGSFAAVVGRDGYVYNTGALVHYGKFAVRPALKINLSSPVFTSAIVSYPPKKERKRK